MNKKLTIVYTLFFLIFSLNTAIAQVNQCALNLVEAEKQFNAGQIEEVPGLLLDCIEEGFTTEDRKAALKLLINTYIFDDYPDRAENYMLIFLNDYPDYIISDDDPFEFVNLFEQFDNKLRYSIGVLIGMNIAHPRVTEPFAVYNLNEVEGKYSTKPGIRIGGIFNYYLNPSLELSIEPMFSLSKILFEVDPFPFTSTKYTEIQKRFDLPLSLAYSFNKKRLSPFLRFGINNSFLLSAEGETTRTYSNTGGVDYEDIISDAMDISDERASINLAFFFGGGLRYNISRSYIFAEIRYGMGMVNQVVTESRRNTQNDDIWLFYNQHDDYFLNNLSFNIGFTRKIFNPKRIE